MAAGDLITRDGQYEFNGVLLNDSLTDADVTKVISSSGLFNLPDSKTTESELQDDHGGSVGRELLTMRRIAMDLEVIASTKAALYNRVEALAAAFQPQSAVLPLVYQRAGVGKRFINVKPRRMSGFDLNYLAEKRRISGSVLLIAPDPRKLAFVQSSQVFTIPASGTTISGIITMAGNFNGGAKPIIEIPGPVTNPRIGNAADGGRYLRIDMVINAGQTLIINAHDRSLLMGGVDQSTNVRSDNQWWSLMRGANNITVTRSNNPATAVNVVIKWWNSYV